MEDILIKMKETHALLITKQQQQEKCSKKSMLDNKTWITWETFVSLNHRQKKDIHCFYNNSVNQKNSIELAWDNLYKKNSDAAQLMQKQL